MRYVLALLACAACKPALPPIAGCVAGVYHCTPDGRPEVCSASSRWEPIGDAPCSRVGARYMPKPDPSRGEASMAAEYDALASIVRDLLNDATA